MAKSIGASAKRRGRPITTGTGITIGVRMLVHTIAAVDAWITKQKEPALSRPEAIRRLVERALTTEKSHGNTSSSQRSRAKEMATAAIDRMSDPNAPANVKAVRKQRLLKGPEEFQEKPVDRVPTKKK